MTREWRTVSAYPAYEVSNDGLIRNTRWGKLIRGSLYKTRGYVVVCFGKNTARKSLHSVVAEAFIGPRPDGMHIDHVNGNKLDNAASNLRYCTPRENCLNAVRNGQAPVGERNGQAKLTADQVRAIRSAHAVARAAGIRNWGAQQYAKQFGVHRTQITRVVAGLRHACVPQIAADLLA